VPPQIVIPVKSFSAAKQRLSSSLNSAERAQLAEAMCLDVIEIAITVAPVLVVTHAPEVGRIATAAGAEVLLEDGMHGHRHAAERAVRALSHRPEDMVLLIPSDAPAVSADELRDLLQRATSPGDLVLVPNRDGEGTNGMCFRAGRSIPFHFGPGSLAKHRSEAKRLSLRCQVVEKDGLALDIDTADDLVELRRRRRMLPKRTAAFLCSASRS